MVHVSTPTTSLKASFGTRWWRLFREGSLRSGFLLHARIADTVESSKGTSGSNVEYVLNLCHALRDLDMRDPLSTPSCITFVMLCALVTPFLPLNTDYALHIHGNDLVKCSEGNVSRHETESAGIWRSYQSRELRKRGETSVHSLAWGGGRWTFSRRTLHP